MGGAITDICKALIGSSQPATGILIGTDPPSTLSVTDADGGYGLCVPAGVPFTTVLQQPGTQGVVFLGETIFTTNQASIILPVVCQEGLTLGLGNNDTPGTAAVIMTIVSQAFEEDACGADRALWSENATTLEGGAVDGTFGYFASSGNSSPCPTNLGIAIFTGIDPALQMLQTSILANGPCGTGAPVSDCNDLAGDLGFTGRVKIGPRPGFLSIAPHFLP
jgi:hypothetical protein